MNRSHISAWILAIFLAFVLVIVGCDTAFQGEDGVDGHDGAPGEQGLRGYDGFPCPDVDNDGDGVRDPCVNLEGNTPDIVPGTITRTMLEDGAVNGAKIAGGSITKSHISGRPGSDGLISSSYQISNDIITGNHMDKTVAIITGSTQIANGVIDWLAIDTSTITSIDWSNISTSTNKVGCGAIDSTCTLIGNSTQITNGAVGCSDIQSNCTLISSSSQISTLGVITDGFTLYEATDSNTIENTDYTKLMSRQITGTIDANANYLIMFDATFTISEAATTNSPAVALYLGTNDTCTASPQTLAFTTLPLAVGDYPVSLHWLGNVGTGNPYVCVMWKYEDNATGNGKQGMIQYAANSKRMLSIVEFNR